MDGVVVVGEDDDDQHREKSSSKEEDKGQRETTSQKVVTRQGRYSLSRGSATEKRVSRLSVDPITGEPNGPPIRVNVYDLADIGMCVDVSGAVSSLNKHTMGMWDVGVFHAGVEIEGVEYSFGYCESGTGVYACLPREAYGARFRTSVDMGRSTLAPRAVDLHLARLAATWPGASYSVLSKNCCHFAEALCLGLGVGRLPPWVNGLAASLSRYVGGSSAASPLFTSASSDLVPSRDHVAFRKPQPTSEDGKNLLEPRNSSLADDGGASSSSSTSPADDDGASFAGASFADEVLVAKRRARQDDTMTQVKNGDESDDAPTQTLASDGDEATATASAPANAADKSDQAWLPLFCGGDALFGSSASSPSSFGEGQGQGQASSGSTSKSENCADDDAKRRRRPEESVGEAKRDKRTTGSSDIHVIVAGPASETRDHGREKRTEEPDTSSSSLWAAVRCFGTLDDGARARDDDFLSPRGDYTMYDSGDDDDDDGVESAYRDSVRLHEFFASLAEELGPPDAAAADRRVVPDTHAPNDDEAIKPHAPSPDRPRRFDALDEHDDDDDATALDASASSSSAGGGVSGSAETSPHAEPRWRRGSRRLSAKFSSLLKRGGHASSSTPADGAVSSSGGR